MWACLGLSLTSIRKNLTPGYIQHKDFAEYQRENSLAYSGLHSSAHLPRRISSVVRRRPDYSHLTQRRYSIKSPLADQIQGRQAAPALQALQLFQQLIGVQFEGERR